MERPSDGAREGKKGVEKDEGVRAAGFASIGFPVTSTEVVANLSTLKAAPSSSSSSSRRPFRGRPLRAQERRRLCPATSRRVATASSTTNSYLPPRPPRRALTPAAKLPSNIVSVVLGKRKEREREREKEKIQTSPPPRVRSVSKLTEAFPESLSF